MSVMTEARRESKRGMAINQRLVELKRDRGMIRGWLESNTSRKQRVGLRKLDKILSLSISELEHQL